MKQAQINPKEIKQIASDLIKKIDAEAAVSVACEKDGVVNVDVKTCDPQILIGRNNETLQAIQHLLRVMARRISGGQCFIDLDVNEYRKKRNSYLKDLAVSSANDASLSKKEVSLPSMNAYERRIIHMALAERKDVATESRGYEEDRHIVIKPTS